MEVPDTLRRKMDLYRTHGRVVRENEELFTPIGWQQVLHGQGVRPAGYNSLVDLMEEKELRNILGDIERVIGKCVNVMPTHKEFIEAVARAGQPNTARR
jgi:tryptophan halogenase